MFNRTAIRVLAFSILSLGVLVFMSPPASAAEVKATFYGNQHFRFVSTEGTVILLNPWIKGNADATVKVEDFNKGDVDVILATSGHGDDMGQSAEIAARTGATVFAAAGAAAPGRAAGADGFLSLRRNAPLGVIQAVAAAVISNPPCAGLRGSRPSRTASRC